ncbi:cytochrome d terminal oxidase, subunit II [Georgfuchsia toluolica]|uniref:Cytochrome d terminal oxidase, subunit II n=1 Tax=Georgfuchsia toluolica TaxID=424218 RepID=A0A916N1U4_9PROT|nr:cytochrome d ubiquinol oxidase subunit II [Georgfuchsia toluolica]CAG4883059.1 cytochrome d terminal oxidase, subunit II [Georgfuchsia toluolica]
MFDYMILKLVWWLLVGVLLIGFAIMDGHDMGVGILLPFLGKDDTDRRVMINSVAPHWDGNQVWFVTGGGAVFAAWPFVYATAFSGLYWALLLVLFALFFRPVGFEYRSKLPNPGWRKGWDMGLFAGSAVPALVFGVAFGNLFQGVPFSLDDTMRTSYSGSFWTLLNPLALLFGVVSLSMITLQGATFLSHRTEGALQQRAMAVAKVFAIVLLASFATAGLWVSRIDGYVIQSIPDVSGVLNPLMKEVGRQSGAWFANYGLHPTLWLVPVIGFLGALLALLMVAAKRTLLAFVSSSLACLGIILTAGVSLFPFILPSSEMPKASLTLWDATSSQFTLNVMFWVTLIFTPIVLAYTSWAYAVMSGKVTREFVETNDKSLY